MTSITRLEVNKADINQTRWADASLPALQEGDVKLKVDHFAFTANNITYGVIGEQFGYWKFYPVEEDGWGIIPVWGFADVTESRHPDFEVGERIYGYLPMSTDIIVKPGGIQDNQFRDISAHRENLPAIYNVFVRLKADPFYDPDLEAYRALWFPLAGTSFGLADWLQETDYQGADTILLVSASSKTSLGLAYLLDRSNLQGKTVAGLTSARNKAAVQDTGYYDKVYAYNEVSAMDAVSPTVIVDFSGNGTTLAELHRHLGDNMKHTVIVGASHWDEERKGEGYIDERSRLFFMPAYAAERAKATGGQFVTDLYAASQAVAKDASKWMKVVSAETRDEISQLYLDVKDGNLATNEGGIMTFSKL
ncbi:MAG: DUF2855 family protein [Aquisalinus sp.]|nr:DUF2855 family protein [Aquisalinus sp.]